MGTFRSWFIESEREYDKLYRADMAQHGQENPKPFQDWFPKGQDRIYLPFIIHGLWNVFMENFLTAHGFKLIDYRKGLVSSERFPDRQQRLMPVLQQIARIDNTGNAALAVRLYEQDPMRLNEGPNEFTIAISQNPHDIARMSYDKHWELGSCMRLGDNKKTPGSKMHQVYDEVKEGGLIAYLIEPDDKDIKHPYSRVLIRRFTNGNKDIAACEATVYGLNKSNFLETVMKWVEQQQDRTYGTYNLKGAEWSDTYPNQYAFTIKRSDVRPDNETELLKALKTFKEPRYEQEFIDVVETILKGVSVAPFTSFVTDKKFSNDFWISLIKDTNEMLSWNHYANSSIHIGYKKGFFSKLLPQKAFALHMPVAKVHGILNAYPLTTITNTLNHAPEGYAEWLLPVLSTMITKSPYGLKYEELKAIAQAIADHPILQSSEFLDNFTPDTTLEIYHYSNDNKVKSILIKKLFINWKEELKKLAQEYENDPTEEETIIDKITTSIDDATGLFVHHKVNNAIEEILPPELYDRLYGHDRPRVKRYT